MKRFMLVGLGIVTFVLCGCVERTMHVKSDPPGALVFVNGDERGRTPYIEHPRAVAKNFKEPRLIALALLHDVVEDSNITLQDLKEDFGIPQKILDSLNRLTKRKLESYADYIVTCLQDPDARTVKIEDIKHNIQTSSGNQKAKYELALYVLEKK